MTTSTEPLIATRHATLYTLLDVYRAPATVLEGIMREHPAPAFADLVGWEFNGANVGALPGLIGIRKFRKGFYEGPPRSPTGPTPYIQGYNIPVKQDGVERPWRAKPSDERPKRFGFYRIYPAVKNADHHRYEQALLLDYGLGANGPTPPAMLRDYLVQVHPGSSDLLLGYAIFAAGPVTVPGGFFVIERAHKHTFKG